MRIAIICDSKITGRENFNRMARGLGVDIGTCGLVYITAFTSEESLMGFEFDAMYLSEDAILAYPTPTVTRLLTETKTRLNRE